MEEETWREGGREETASERGGEGERRREDFGDSTQLSCSKQKHMTTETR